MLLACQQLLSALQFNLQLIHSPTVHIPAQSNPPTTCPHPLTSSHHYLGPSSGVTALNSLVTGCFILLLATVSKVSKACSYSSSESKVTSSPLLNSPEPQEVQFRRATNAEKEMGLGSSFYFRYITLRNTDHGIRVCLKSCNQCFQIH